MAQRQVCLFFPSGKTPKWIVSISRWLIFIQRLRAPGPFHLVAPQFSTHHFHCRHAPLHHGFSRGVSKPVSEACYFSSPSLDISNFKECWEMKSSCVSRRKRKQLSGYLASFCLGLQGFIRTYPCKEWREGCSCQTKRYVQMFWGKKGLGMFEELR